MAATIQFKRREFPGGQPLEDGEPGFVTGSDDLYVGNDGENALIGGQTARKVVPLFDHYASVGNVGTGEDDLYSDTTAAGQLATDGDKLEAEYSGVFVFSATATRRLRVYFGGTAIFDSGALAITTSDAAWQVSVSIIRESATVVRCAVSMLTRASVLPEPAYTRVTGLTLSSTNILKITGEAAGVGAATDDIVAKLGAVRWIMAA